jgi:hypothetical protein
VVDARRPGAQLPEEDDDVRRDQRVVDEREAAGGGQVEERKDRANLLDLDLTDQR